MKFISLLMVLSLLFLVSCSGGSNNEDVDASSDVEMSADGLEGDELDLDEETEGDLASMDEGEGKAEGGEEGAPAEGEAAMAGEGDDMMADEGEAVAVDTEGGAGGASTVVTGEVGEYTVESGDTLMLIAFKLYGDYRKWHDIQNLNPVSATSLRVGQTIKYNVPASKFVWNPEGNPHLIIRGETLGTISDKYYNTTTKWRNIWNNNRAMIKDPNLIFAGFTIFYPSLGDLASN